MRTSRSLLLSFGSLVIAAVVTGGVAPHLVAGQAPRPVAGAPAPRHFYLTPARQSGGAALTACARGFHMASVWEIIDPSNLKYDTTKGFSQDDSGSGPPTLAGGWVRTGGEANETGVPGTSNCNAWTSNNPFGEGTVMALPPIWTATDLSVINPWFAGGEICAEPTRVWCVQD